MVLKILASLIHTDKQCKSHLEVHIKYIIGCIYVNVLL